MSHKKQLLLIIIHRNQVVIPSVKEILNNPAYDVPIKNLLSTCTKEGDVKKLMKRFTYSLKKTVTNEQIFLSDRSTHKQMCEATIVIDVDDRKILKCRLVDVDYEEMVSIYLNKYKDQINDFNTKFRSIPS